MVVYDQSSEFQLSKYPCSHFELQSESLTIDSHLWLLAALHNQVICISHFPAGFPRKSKPIPCTLLYLSPNLFMPHCHSSTSTHLTWTSLCLCVTTVHLFIPTSTQKQPPRPRCTWITPCIFAPLHADSTSHLHLSCLLACLQATWDIQLPVSFPVSLVVTRGSCEQVLF